MIRSSTGMWHSRCCREEDLQDDRSRGRLLREARSAAALNHPHICTIHEVGEAEGHAYIAMEFIDGSRWTG